MKTLALTDSGNLYGAIEFYKECIEAEIKPIIGVDFYVAPRTRHDKEHRVDNATSRIVLLAQNETGYKNLLKLVTASYLEGLFDKPRLDRELLEQHHEGLIAISKEKKYYPEIFGDRFYLGVGPQNIGEVDKKEKQIVAFYDVYYLEPEESEIREVLMSIGGELDINNTFMDEEELTFVSAKQAWEDFENLPEAVENTSKIADLCDLKLELGKWVFPNFIIERGLTPDEELRRQAEEGFSKRGVERSEEYLKRVEYELEIIKNKGYSKYFLVVADLLRYAHENGILTNTRGSAAGSLVSYLTGITTVNPMVYDLPFERFLNPDRPSAPDIDMDIADNRRDEIIEYAKNRYGAEHVGQIGTFGTMMARGAVRDITRALHLPYALGDSIAKLIPFGAQGFPMTIDRALKENPDLKTFVDDNEDAQRIIQTAKKIEGNARHISVHAAGVVISPEPLTHYTALQYDTKGEGKVITQYDMYSIEEAGLLKFDFLGIRNLSIIADALERIKKIEGIELKMEDIPLDDKKTFDMLSRGETEGTFQMNGSGMTKALMDLRPTVIHDINVMVALYRPGPMDNIQEYIARKNGKKPVTFMHPKMESFLKPTYGVLVYQDDLLMTAIHVAGYTWGEVDKFRKAVGKKIPEEMKKQHILFVEGCQKNGGMSKEKAEGLWDLFVPFQGYGFNKAHAASYGYIAYITAYLKANFPAIYMSAILTAESGDVDTIGIMVNECKRMGIEVLPPSINESFSQFSVVKDESDKYKIRFGLTTIKNFGQSVSTAITAERKSAGKFKGLSDFLERIKDKNLNKKSLESLIKSGALDEYGERGELMHNLESLLAYHKAELNTSGSQSSLFDTSGIASLRLEKGTPATLKEKLSWEKELLGLYVSGHPLEEYKDKFLAKDINIKKLEEFREGAEAVIGGIVETARDVLTKNNERMVFMRLSDFSGSIEVAIFPRVLSEFRQFIQSDACIAIKGRVSKRKGETSFIAEKIKAL